MEVCWIVISHKNMGKNQNYLHWIWIYDCCIFVVVFPYYLNWCKEHNKSFSANICPQCHCLYHITGFGNCLSTNYTKNTTWQASKYERIWIIFCSNHYCCFPFLFLHYSSRDLFWNCSAYPCQYKTQTTLCRCFNIPDYDLFSSNNRLALSLVQQPKEKNNIKMERVGKILSDQASWIIKMAFLSNRIQNYGLTQHLVI